MNETPELKALMAAARHAVEMWDMHGPRLTEERENDDPRKEAMEEAMGELDITLNDFRDANGL